MERLFPTDELTKRERVERTLRHESVDRVALHDQVSYNPGVVSHYTGRPIEGFAYGAEDIACVIRRSLDMCFPIFPPIGTERVTTADGFVQQNDNWTSWHVSRPFTTPEGAREWLRGRTEALRSSTFDAPAARVAYREQMASLQALVGETVIFNWSFTGFAGVFDTMGLELFVYFYHDTPQLFTDYLELSTDRELQRIRAIADPALSPLILIPEDFATKQGPIFPPEFLAREHFPFVTRLAEEWHRHGLHVIYHSDGNYKKVIPNLIACGLDGFYCLEPGVGMDIVELKNTWPQMVWAGGVDGVDLMERGTPEQVRAEVRRHLTQTDARHTGGMFVGSSSEINPPIKVENYLAMVDAVGEPEDGARGANPVV
ncbi:MAG: uroporphyrinogen decarboxylase family protein [Armatimonadota bacterium]